jgi:hypothetical protein
MGTTSTTRPTSSVVVLDGQTQSLPTESEFAPTALPSDPVQHTPEPSSQREGNSTQESETTSKSEDNNHTAVGVGVGIGVGVGVSFALVGAFAIWRRYSRKKENHSKRQEIFNSGLGFQGYPHQAWEMSQSQEKMTYIHVDGRAVVAEAPAFPMSPRELAARNSHPSRGIGTNAS